MFACRTDKNHLCITNSLRQIGCSVQDLSTVGNGCPDIIVGFRGKNYFLEIKSEKGKLNKRQIRYHKHWQGQVATIKSFEDALDVLGVSAEFQ